MIYSENTHFLTFLILLFLIQIFFLKFSSRLQVTGASRLTNLLKNLRQNSFPLFFSSLEISFLTQNSSAMSSMSLALSRSGLLSFRQTVTLLLTSPVGSLVFLSLSLFLINYISFDFVAVVFLIGLVFFKFPQSIFVKLHNPIKTAFLFLFLLLLIHGSLESMLFSKSFMPLISSVGIFSGNFFLQPGSEQALFFLLPVLLYFLTGTSFVWILLFISMFSEVTLGLLAVASVLLAQNLWTLFEIRKGSLLAARGVFFTIFIHTLGISILYLSLPFLSSYISQLSPFLLSLVCLAYVLFLSVLALVIISLDPILKLSRLFKISKKRHQKLTPPCLEHHFSSPWALEQIHQEVKRLSVNISNFLILILSALDQEHFGDIQKKLKKYEKIMTSVKLEISDFMEKIDTSSLSKAQNQKLKGLILMIERFDSLSDHCLDFFQTYSHLRNMNVSLDKETLESFEILLKRLVDYYESVFVVISGQGDLAQGERGRYERKFLDTSETFREKLFEASSQKRISKEIVFCFQKMKSQMEMIHKLSKKILKLYTGHFNH